MGEREEILLGLIALGLGTWAVIVLIRWFLHSTITLGIKNASKDPEKNKHQKESGDYVGVEFCQNCNQIIGKLEQAYVYKNKIICKECNIRLNTKKAQ